MIALPATVPPASTPPPGGNLVPALPPPSEGGVDDFAATFAKQTARPALVTPTPPPEGGATAPTPGNTDEGTVEGEETLPLLPNLAAPESPPFAAVEPRVDQTVGRAKAAQHAAGDPPLGATDVALTSPFGPTLPNATPPATKTTAATARSGPGQPALAQQVPQPIPPEARPTPRSMVDRVDPGTTNRATRPVSGDVPVGGSPGPETLSDPTSAFPAQGEPELSATARVEEGAPQMPVTDTRRIGAEHHGATNRAGPDAPPPAERQIVTAILSSGTGRTDILLDPQDLGRVRLSLEGNEAGLVVTVIADRAETADLLRRNADLLLAEFRDAGYANLSFSFSDRGQNTDAWPDADAAPDGHSTRPDTLPATESARPLYGAALLDLRL